MKCETIRNMMSSYIDKDLNDIEKTEMEEHLAACEECKKEYMSLFDVIALCSNFEEIELPQNFRTELHQRLVEEKKKKGFFGGILGKKGMKAATALVAAVLVIAIGIGSFPLLFNKSTKMDQNRESASNYGRASLPAASAPSDYADAGFTENKAKEIFDEAAAAESPQITSAQGVLPKEKGLRFGESIEAEEQAFDSAIQSPGSSRMVIKSGNISVDVENVDKATAGIRKLTESSGGYVENSHVENITVPKLRDENRGSAAGEDTEKYANMTVRVPEARFNEILNSIKSMGKQVSENISGSDITMEYRDTKARTDNLKIQEQSLKQLMTKAKNVEEILKIESELNRVRTDIDIYSGNLKRWDNLVQLSTIHIFMREMKPEELKSVDVPGMWEKAYKGFVKAINNIIACLEKTVIALITATPYLIIAGVLAAIGIAVLKKVKVKKL